MNTILLFIMSLSLLLNVLCDECNEKINPTQLSDCENLQVGGGGVCCFAQSPGYHVFETMCVNITDYREQREYWDGLERWRLECPSKSYEKKKYELCGGDYPMNAIDCWKYSTPQKSCCYTNRTGEWCYGNKCEIDPVTHFNTMIKNVTPECRWYKKDQGNFTNEDDKNIQQEYRCSCSYFSISFSFFGLLTLLLI